MSLTEAALDQLAYERDCRDRGMVAAVEHAETWSERAWRILLMLADTRRPFTADVIHELCGAPPSSGAVGALFKAAAQRKVIQAVGLRQSKRDGRHAGLVRAWVGI